MDQNILKIEASRLVDAFKLQDTSYKNNINITEAEKIWLPVVVFYNTKKKKESKVLGYRKHCLKI